jgi:hypothetical protein
MRRLARLARELRRLARRRGERHADLGWLDDDGT